MNIESPMSGVPINSGVTNTPSSIVINSTNIGEQVAPKNGVKNAVNGDLDKTPESTDKLATKNVFNNSKPSPLDTTTEMAFDKATGLMQNIVSDRITDKVIRKIPSDEYIRLHRLLDEMVGGFVDKKI